MILIKIPDEITPVVYSNASSLPLNVAYLSTNNSDKGNRFGREVKKLLLLLTDTGEGYSEALTYQTQWMPHALPFSATYPQNVYVEGTDFFYDENTLVRSVVFVQTPVLFLREVFRVRLIIINLI